MENAIKRQTVEWLLRELDGKNGQMLHSAWLNMLNNAKALLNELISEYSE